MSDRSIWRGLALAAALATAGCASTGPDPDTLLISDPLEPVNRQVHNFNVGVDRVAIRPISQAYEVATPELVKHLLRNVANHVSLVGIFANYTLQGDLDGAGETLGRFAVNTFMGGAGLLDPATDIGLPLRPTDFGVTLAEWGLGEGPFVMLPLFGPSTARDVLGSAVDATLLNPFTYAAPGSGSGETALRVANRALPPIDQRAAQTEIIDDVLYGPNSYTRLKAFYVQNRRQAIRGDELDIEALPDIFGEE